MDERQLHNEFMSILGESHPGLTFEEYRDSTAFLLFYQYCCLRFDQELEDNYKLKEMVRLAIRGKLQMPSFLRFMEAASDFIYMVSGQYMLTDFSFFKKLKTNQSQEKQKSFARYIRKLIKKIDSWDSDDMLFLHFDSYFEDLMLGFSRMKKETNISEGILYLVEMLFKRSGSGLERILFPQINYGAFTKRVTDPDYLSEIYAYDDNPVYLEIQSMLYYMKNIPSTKAHICSKEEFDKVDGLAASADRIVVYMPEGINNGELMCAPEDLPYDKELISSRAKGELPFLLSALMMLKKEGAMIAVLPSAMLYREGKEAQIRRFLIEEMKALDTVILLPDQMFQSSGQKEVLLYFKMNRKREDLLFFDATEYTRPDEDQLEDIKQDLEKREDQAGLCASVSVDKIRENSYNLNLPRYITKSVREIKLDIESQKKRISQIDRELVEIEEKIKMYKRDLELV